jgi:putative tricarboxylic transport membrane protein
VLGVVLGFMVESNYRRALVLSGGDHAIFVQDPIALGLLVAAAAVVALSLRREVRLVSKERPLSP